MNRIVSRIMRIAKSDEAIVFIFSLIIGCLFAYYSYDIGLTRLFGDPTGHLNIARRVVDSLTPGLAQLGSVWLPFVHVSMLPFIWNDFLWQTGLAGTIPSLIYFVITSVFLYKLAFRYFKDKQISYLVVLIFICNPYTLYFAIAAMFEMTFMMTLVLSTYYFYRWLETSKLIHLSISSFFIALSTLTWYPGWALPLVFLFFLIMKLRVDGSEWGKIRSHITLYCLGAFFGIFLWTLFNWFIFGNPLDFLINKDYSVKIQSERKFIPTRYDPWGSITTAIYAIDYMISAPLLIFSMLGGLIMLYKGLKLFFRERDVKILSLFALASPGIFFTTGLFWGFTKIEIGAGGVDLNIRYYLTMLPFVAVFTASFINQAKRYIEPNKLKIFLLLSLIIPFPFYNITTIEDTFFMKCLAIDYPFHFSEIYDDGTIFKQAHPGRAGGQLTILQKERGVHLSNIIYIGNYPYYDNASREPWNYTKWLILNKGLQRRDEFSAKWKNNKLLHKLYFIMYEDHNIKILKLNESALPYLNIYQQPGYFEIEDATFHGYLHFIISNFDDFQPLINITIKCGHRYINTSIYYVMPNSDREINMGLPEECYTCENITLVIKGEKYAVEKVLNGMMLNSKCMGDKNEK